MSLDSQKCQHSFALEKFRIDAEVDGGAAAVDIILPHPVDQGRTSLGVSTRR